LSSQLISSVVTISLGLLGYGAMSLAIGSIVQTFTYAFILQFYKPSDFKMRLSTKKIREIFNYSKYVVGSTFIFEFSNNFSQLVIGKHYTLADVGMYSRAVSTGVLFNKFIADAISPVITPYIAKASRESISIKESYQRIARMHNALAWPFFFYLALLADPVIYILFGEQWKEAAIFLTIICIDRIIGCTLPMTDAVFHGLGKAKQLMYLNGFLHSSRIVLVALTYKVGLVEMILTMSILTPTIGTLGRYWLINKYLGLEFREIVQDLRHPLILSILVILPPISLMLFSYTIYHLSNIQILIISSVISSLLWLKASWHSELVSFGKKMLNRKDA
jgi:O-antigen/teichoic acid export membrane protein